MTAAGVDASIVGACCAPWHVLPEAHFHAPFGPMFGKMSLPNDTGQASPSAIAPPSHTTASVPPSPGMLSRRSASGSPYCVTPTSGAHDKATAIDTETATPIRAPAAPAQRNMVQLYHLTVPVGHGAEVVEALTA